MSENSRESRLPPPAFPPGARKRVMRRSSSENSSSVGAGTIEDAFISPDDEMPPRRGALDQAFISPDDPIPERKLELLEEFRDHAAFDEDEEGQVVGMDMEPIADADEVASGGDPHVMEVITALAALAESMKRKGEAGLKATADMSRFGATLRAYCVGYLAGRRAEEPAVPAMDEALPSDF